MRRARAGARAVPLFLLGALVGGAVGGVTGAMTTLLWLQYADDRPARAAALSVDRGASVPSIERGTAVTDNPAAATRDAEVLAPSASVGPGTAKRGGTIDPAR